MVKMSFVVPAVDYCFFCRRYTNCFFCRLNRFFNHFTYNVICHSQTKNNLSNDRSKLSVMVQLCSSNTIELLPFVVLNETSCPPIDHLFYSSQFNHVTEKYLLSPTGNHKTSQNVGLHCYLDMWGNSLSSMGSI